MKQKGKPKKQAKHTHGKNKKSTHMNTSIK